jgi:quercetin dioxygenase-like cupin family protein
MNPSPDPNALSRVDAGEVLEFPWGRITWIVSRKLGNSTVMTFGRVLMRARMSNPRHRHPNCDEILHLLSGRIDHTLGAESFVMEAGDTISIPAGVWHQARALDGADAEMVIAFSSADRETEMES